MNPFRYFGRTLWTGNWPIVRPQHTQDTITQKNAHIHTWNKQDSNTVSQCSSYRTYAPQTARPLGSASRLTYLLHGARHSLKSWYPSYERIVCFLYGTRSFITMFTKVHYWTLSQASSIQDAPLVPISLRSILILSSHLLLGLPSSLLPLGLPTKTL